MLSVGPRSCALPSYGREFESSGGSHGRGVLGKVWVHFKVFGGPLKTKCPKDFWLVGVRVKRTRVRLGMGSVLTLTLRFQ